MLDDSYYLTATDLKQFSYCPRVFYFMRCLPRVRPVTYKMKAGIEEHESEQKRALRRTLSKYEVEGKGQRQFDVAICDDEWAVQAKLDEVVTCENGEIFPVDYKLTEKAGEHFKVQLALYALLLERHHSCTVKRGFLYLLPKREMIEVPINQRLRREVVVQLAEMKTIVEQEAIPQPTARRNCCIDCEFRRFCNDVL